MCSHLHRHSSLKHYLLSRQLTYLQQAEAVPLEGPCHVRQHFTSSIKTTKLKVKKKPNQRFILYFLYLLCAWT